MLMDEYDTDYHANKCNTNEINKKLKAFQVAMLTHCSLITIIIILTGIIIMCNLPIDNIFISEYNKYITCTYYDNTTNTCLPIEPFYIDDPDCACPTNYTCGSVSNPQGSVSNITNTITNFCYNNDYTGSLDKLYHNCNHFDFYNITPISEYYNYYFVTSCLFVISLTIFLSIITVTTRINIFNGSYAIISLVIIIIILKFINIIITFIMLSEYKIFDVILCTNIPNYYGLLYQIYWFVGNFITIFSLLVFMGIR